MTPEQIKERLRQEGRTMKDWSRERGVSDYAAVRRLMNGFNKGAYGKAHEIAVSLGIKNQHEGGLE
jgi:gp16 family phage-associated protein